MKKDSNEEKPPNLVKKYFKDNPDLIVTTNNLFNVDYLNDTLNKLNKIPVKYMIVVDTYKKDNTDSFCYCLMRKDMDGVSDVVMSKTMTNKDDFEEEVLNLSKYFNAYIIKEID